MPTLYHDLLTQRERGGHGSGPGPDIASVKKLGFAGAPMHDALLKRLQAAFEPELFVNHYGSSEMYTFSIDQQALDKPGSAGRAGINTRLRVVRLDASGVDDRVAPGVEGQIIADLRGDEAFEGYWKRDGRQYQVLCVAAGTSPATPATSMRMATCSSPVGWTT